MFVSWYSLQAYVPCCSMQVMQHIWRWQHHICQNIGHLCLKNKDIPLCTWAVIVMCLLHLAWPGQKATPLLRTMGSLLNRCLWWSWEGYLGVASSWHVSPHILLIQQWNSTHRKGRLKEKMQLYFVPLLNPWVLLQTKHGCFHRWKMWIMSGHSQRKREESIDIRALKKQGMGTVYQGKVIKINPREELVTFVQTWERKYWLFRAQGEVVEEPQKSCKLAFKQGLELKLPFLWGWMYCIAGNLLCVLTSNMKHPGRHQAPHLGWVCSLFLIDSRAL